MSDLNLWNIVLYYIYIDKFMLFSFVTAQNVRMISTFCVDVIVKCRNSKFCVDNAVTLHLKLMC